MRAGREARPTKSLVLGTNQTVRDVIIYLAGLRADQRQHRNKRRGRS